jgi:hypothetical protein
MYGNLCQLRTFILLDTRNTVHYTFPLNFTNTLGEAIKVCLRRTNLAL